jgi:hypothetical protein
MPFPLHRELLLRLGCVVQFTGDRKPQGIIEENPYLNDW